MGTLYLVDAPVGSPEDMTLRAQRILDEAALIVADSGSSHVDQLLALHGIATPFTVLCDSDPPASLGYILETLEAGDVALLTLGLAPGPSVLCQRLVRASQGHGFRVASVPGPSLLVAALVLSGLPAESFRYLGEIPQQSQARLALLSSVATERRSLILIAPPGRLSEILPDLASILGERPLAMMLTVGPDVEVILRGMVGRVNEQRLSRLDLAPAILIIGGARKQVAQWDEHRLRTQIRICRDQGLGAKEISQQLARESGWSRREIYRLVGPSQVN